jgi:GTP diphosphokinase / guanosine-3',5'-bis(diphosphate) 3'-diphosphatase
MSQSSTPPGGAPVAVPTATTVVPTLAPVFTTGAPIAATELADHDYPKLAAAIGYLSQENQARVEAAYRFANRAHWGVARKSGEPYITHPVAVALILAEMSLDADSIIAGLLHDTVEDTPVTPEEIEAQFGPDVRRIVEGETKLSKMRKYANSVLENEQAENMRQLLIQMSGDIRIIVVKLADRLHNMRTLQHMKPEKQQRIARETLDIYAPLAHRLGIGQIKWQLEDLSFKYLYNEEYQALATSVRTGKEEREAYITRALAALREVLQEDRDLGRWLLRFEVSGRSKHLYSIWGKMTRDHRDLQQIFDLLAIRVILEPRPLNDAEINFRPDPKDNDEVRLQKREKLLTKAEIAREGRICYHVISMVHSLWTPIPGRFKDYIAVPKPNGYQSLHSTVIAFEGKPLEVQVRTAKMHALAESGVAAHWLYKAGVGDPVQAERLRNNLDWVQTLRALSGEFIDAGDFLDYMQSDELAKKITVFTPKGKTLSLPEGATPLDFAYHIHTDVGHHTIGARVNGQMVTLATPLNTGDRVEILTNRGSKGPSRDWLNTVATRSAKAKIRQFFRSQSRQDDIARGHDGLASHLRGQQLPTSKLMLTALLERATNKLLHSSNPDDLYLAMAAGRLHYGHVTRVLQEEHAAQLALSTPAPPPKPERKIKVPPAPKTITTNTVFIEGLGAQEVKFARCCNPERPDEVIAYIGAGARGLSLHRATCPSAKRLKPERCHRAFWDMVTLEAAAAESSIMATLDTSLPKESDLPEATDFVLIAVDRVGLLQEVLVLLMSWNKSALKVEANVYNLEAHILVRLEVRRSELQEVRSALSGVASVRQVLVTSLGQ